MSAVKVGDRVRIRWDEGGAPIGTLVTVTKLLSDSGLIYVWENSRFTDDGWWASVEGVMAA